MVRIVAGIFMKPIRQSFPRNQVERHVSGDKLKCDNPNIWWSDAIQSAFVLN
jgi:hypothetical protein